MLSMTRVFYIIKWQSSMHIPMSFYNNFTWSYDQRTQAVEIITIILILFYNLQLFPYSWCGSGACSLSDYIHILSLHLKSWSEQRIPHYYNSFSIFHFAHCLLCSHWFVTWNKHPSFTFPCNLIYNMLLCTWSKIIPHLKHLKH